MVGILGFGSARVGFLGIGLRFAEGLHREGGKRQNGVADFGVQGQQI